MMKYFIQFWGGTVAYIFTAALLPDSRKYIDFIAKVAQEIKKYWVEYVIQYVSMFFKFVVHFFH